MDSIKFQDKEHPFLFAWSAYKTFLKVTQHIEDDDATFYDKGIHLGFECGAKRSGVKCFSYDDMVNMFDDDIDFQAEANDIFWKQFGVQKKIQEKGLKAGENPKPLKK